MEQINNKPELKVFRRDLRSSSTPAEVRLWKYLKGKNVDNLKFRRQHSIGNYIVDFYCPSKKIAIELDGEIHQNIAIEQHDVEKEKYLNSVGIKVLRISNKVVFENIELVLEKIKGE